MNTAHADYTYFDVMKSRKTVIIRLVIKPYYGNNYGIFFEKADGRSAGFRSYPGMSERIVIGIAARSAQRFTIAKKGIGYRRNNGAIRVSSAKREKITGKPLSNVLRGIRHGNFDDAYTALRMAKDNKQFRVIGSMVKAANYLSGKDHYSKLKSDAFTSECSA